MNDHYLEVIVNKNAILLNDCHIILAKLIHYNFFFVKYNLSTSLFQRAKVDCFRTTHILKHF